MHKCQFDSHHSESPSAPINSDPPLSLHILSGMQQQS